MNSDFRDLLESLNDGQVSYLIVGGYAVGKHTEPRYTKDLDVWVASSRTNAERVYKALVNFGAPVSSISVEDFTDPSSIYQIGVDPVRIDILAGIEGCDFDECWRRRVRSTFGDVDTNFVSIEDLIQMKRHAARPQDLIDAEKLEKRLEMEAEIRKTLPHEEP